MSKINKIFVIGAGGHTRTIIGILKENYSAEQILCIDKPKHAGENILGAKIEYYDFLNNFLENVFVSIGNNNVRKEIFNKIPKKANIINVISNTATIHKSSVCGKGNLISFNSIICPEVRIGDNNIINTGVIIEHESVIGSHCHIAPGSLILGRVKIGDLVFVGAGSIIKDGLSISDNIILGAGSVVIDNITESGVYVGNPIRKVK